MLTTPILSLSPPVQCEWRVCDIKGTVKAMRRERGGSVQTAVQYRFIHQALLEYVTPGIGDHSMFGDAKARCVHPLPPSHSLLPRPVDSYLPQLVGTSHSLSGYDSVTCSTMPDPIITAGPPHPLGHPTRIGDH